MTDDNRQPSSSLARARAVCGTIGSLPGYTLIFLVRAYQRLVSPWLGNNCRFHPSCSQYFILAVKKHGSIVGTYKGIMRICRCHPWHPGGEDWP